MSHGFVCGRQECKDHLRWRPHDDPGSYLQPQVAELVIGMPYHDTDSLEDAGALVVIPGSSDGPDTANAQLIHQGTPGIAGSIEPKDTFGTAPLVRNTDGKGRPELVVGAPGEDNEQGRVYLFSNELEYLDQYVPSDADLPPDHAAFGWRQ